MVMAPVLDPNRLNVGIQLPVQSLSPAFAEDWEAKAGPSELAAVAQAADASGFGYIAVCDHVGIPHDKVESMGSSWWDTVATLSWLAGLTKRTLLVSHCTIPAYRHPLSVAKAWSTLDLISSGRAVLGVGAGHVEAEFEALGVEFATRGAALNESIEALRACFETDTPSHKGRLWDFGGLTQRPRPNRVGGPPIWVGGSSKAAISRAARWADGWLPQGALNVDQVATLYAALKSVGREAEPFDLGALAGPVYVGSADWELGPTLSGPPEKIAHVLSKFAALGAKQVQIRLRSRTAAELIEQIEQFGQEVLPQLAGVKPATLAVVAAGNQGQGDRSVV